MLKRIIKWLEFAPGTDAAGPPIQTGERIDVLAVREDGGVELIIVVHGHLDSSEQTQNLLENKITSYLQQRNSAAFTAEFRYPTADKVHVVIETDGRLPHAIQSLVQRLEPVVQAGNARLLIRGHQHRKQALRHLYFPVLKRGTGCGPTDADPHCSRPSPDA